MTRAWILGAVVALAGAGLTLAQEVQPSAPAAAPAPDAPPAVVAVPPPSDAPPPEEAAPPPRMEHVPVVADTDDGADAKDDQPPPPPPPLKRPRFASAILQGVDKITAETFRFEAKVGEPVRYKGVVLTVHACETTASDEADADSWAHLDVVSQPRTPPGKAAPAPKPVFGGWMSASSPSLHPFEHAGYDLWLIACRTAAPETPAAGHA